MANDVEAGSKANEDSIDYKSVLAFLQKRGLTSTVNVLRNELEGGNSANNSSTSTGSSGMMLFNCTNIIVFFCYDRSDRIERVYLFGY